ncbi:MAG: ACP S-malonyltransferase [Myxococcota bacterium]|nr:ACP S-malonyltransferase [Myxococcota bacterium]
MLALLFPGQGSQVVGMGRDVAEVVPEARAVFERADAVLDFPLSRTCFEGPDELLRRTEVQQPAVLATSIALLRALEARAAVAPAYLAGHSLGEYAALVASGSLELDDALRLVRARGRYMQEAVPEGEGAMAAVMGCSADVVEAACARAREDTGEVVAPANLNGPQQTVISGTARAVDAACAAASEAGARRTRRLAVSAPFHCALMEPAAERLEPELARVAFADPRPPVVTNVEAEPNAEGGRVQDLLRRQVTEPVRFTELVQRLVGLGTTHVLEVGPGNVLSGLVGRIDRGLARASLAAAADLDAAASFAKG